MLYNSRLSERRGNESDELEISAVIFSILIHELLEGLYKTVLCGCYSQVNRLFILLYWREGKT